MAELKLTFLGSPQVAHDGELLDIGASKALSLLVYLVVTGHNHSRDGLGTLFWPDNDQSRARTYLRHALWSLKKEVGEEWLHISREQIGFQADKDVWLDVAVFREKVTAVATHNHPPGQMCSDCLGHLQEAVSLYHDDFLAGFTLPDSPAFDEWQFFQAEELRQMLAGALEQLVEEYTVRQEYDSAINYARRQLSLDPLHEIVHRTLMQLYALGGQQSAALRQYQECVRLLDEELGVEPEAATTTLYETIRTRQFDATEATRGGEPTAPRSKADRYLIGNLFDEGTHGEVYRGQDSQTGEPVIIKRLRPDAVKKDKKLVARFVQEAELLRQLNHPNIVRLLATFEQNNQQHLVMEYVSGGTLAHRLQQQPQLPLGEVLDIALELADALSRAHHLNIIHRDVKPKNVLLAADGTPRLTDFGVARLLKRDGRITETGMLLGSPAYMSPEILQGGNPDVRSDVWSFGVLLFEMLAGQRPFPGKQITAVLVSILNDPTPDIQQTRPDVPEALADLLQQMLVKEPAERLASMRQVAAKLEAIRAGQTIKQSTPTTKGSPDFGEAEPEDAAITPMSAAMPITPFVAREQELARLDEMLHTVLGGQPQLAFILGEAGQGKTALLQAFAQRAQDMHPGLIAAGGNCNAYTGLGDPYLPFREILALLTADLEVQSLIKITNPEHVQRIKRLLPETVRALVETAPDLIDTLVPLTGLLERTAAPSLAGKSWRQQLLAWTSTKPASPETNLQQNALLDQYARLLQALARQAPLLLILDDLQWADPGSIALLFHLGRRLSGFPIFIVGAYRPDEVAHGQDDEPHPLVRVLHELQRLFGDISIDLGQAQGLAFIDAWLDNEPNQLEKFFRQTLYRQTGGHPLFTIELLRAMRERRDLHQNEDGIWQVSTNINWNTMPARVEGAIGERIQRLDPALQEMLQIASVEGEEFTAEVVATVLQLDERESVRLLSRELDKVHALVRAIGTQRVGERRLSRYRFRHILIQRYLYSLLDDVERMYQHEAVGTVLEELHKKQVTEVAVQLARHFEIAQLPEKAAVYLQLAGDQARRAAALQEAISHYQAALSHWPCEDEAGRASLLRKLGECQWMTGQANDALNTFETDYQLFEALGNSEEAGAIQRLIGRVYWEVGNREKSLYHYHQALSILESLPDSVELAWAISSISQMHMLAEEHEQAIKWGERALKLARRLEAEGAIVHALNNIGISYLYKGQLERGRPMLEESIRRAVEGNLPHDACRGYLNLGSGFISLDHYAEAYATYEALYDYANEVHTILYATSALIELTSLDWMSGCWRSALVRGPQIQEWLEQGQSMAYSRTIASELLSQQYNDLGQPHAAYKVLNDIWPTVQSYDELQFTGPCLIELLRSLSAQGKEAEATRVIHDLLDVLARSDYNRYYTIDACLFVCDTLATSATENPLIDDVHTILESLNQDDTPVPVPSLQAAWHEAWGVVAIFRGEQKQSVNSFRRAVELWGTVERPYDQARALKKLGEALVQTGEETEALAAFTQGNKLIEELAAQLDDEETKATFLHSPLVQAIQNGLHNLKT